MAKTTFIFGSDFAGSLITLPQFMHNKLVKCLHLLSRNRQHPGLRVEKLRGGEQGLYSARVDKEYRLVFAEPAEGEIPLVLIGKHDEAYRKADKIAYVRSSTQQVAIPPVIVQEPAIALDLAKLRTKKYLPLARFPTEQPATVGFVTLGFSDVEEIIEITLLRSAFQYRAWRANDHKGHSCSVAWLGVRGKTMDMGMRERGKLHLTVSKESIGIGGRDETQRFP